MRKTKEVLRLKFEGAEAQGATACNLPQPQAQARLRAAP
jgi:hypothetical protein